MRRRVFIAEAAAAAAWPLPTRAQPAKVPVVGVLEAGSYDSQRFWRVLRKALTEAGYVEGQNIRYELRVDDGPDSRLPELAVELVKLKVDVIVPLFTAASLAAKAATQDIPIVMAGPGEPVASGLVASLDQPGGNITGTSANATELVGKCVELFRQLLPAAKRMAVLVDASSSFSGPFLEKVRSVGAANSMAIDPVMIQKYAELDEAFAKLENNRPDALIVQPSLPSRYVAELALKHRMPAAAPFEVFAEEGGLMSYWVDEAELFRQTALIVDKVLKGTKPADIPVEQPKKFELMLNQNTAKTLGLDVPQAFLDRVDILIK